MKCLWKDDMNWTLITVRGFFPALKVLAAGLVLTYITASLGSVLPISLQPLDVLATSVAISAVCVGLFYFRLWRWEAGAVPGCEWCEGPLGGLLIGKRYYGHQLGDYRRCYNCRRANAGL